jgi:hypothetical protein
MAIDILLGPIQGPIQGPARDILRQKLLGLVPPERRKREWISAALQTRVESLIGSWNQKMRDYLPPDLDITPSSLKEWSKS